MRIKREKVDIDYTKTKNFFEARGERYSEEHPYVTIMYQDHDPGLTDARNREETEKILPLLALDGGARVLDMGCGIGRWADAIRCPVASYLGIDFSKSLVEIARKRNTRDNFSFEQMSVCGFKAYYDQRRLEPFTHLIIAGVLIYLNDGDVEELLQALPGLLTPGAVVYLREPVGLEGRLTLKDFYAQELDHDYHSIYRSAEEYRQMLRENAPALSLVQEGFLFDTPALNNRKETSQYFFLLRRESGQ